MSKHFFHVCLFFFSCSSFLFAKPVTDYSLASIYNEPSVFVEGKVNAITGEFYDLEEDLIIQGVEPIRIQRAYLNSSRKDWIFLPHAHAIVDFSEDNLLCTIMHDNGCKVSYKRVSETKKHGYPIYRYEPSDLEGGFSNTSSGEISSRTNLKNNYLIYDERNFKLTLHTADGVEKIYERRRHRHDGESESWRLLSEHLPNGNWLLYDYIKSNDKYLGPVFALSTIRSMNPSKTKQYAKATFLHEDPKGKNKHFFIEGSDGQRLEYRFDLQHDRQSGYLNAVLSDACRSDQFYEHCTHRDQRDLWRFEPDERMISAQLAPQNRRLNIEYYFKPQETVDGIDVVMKDQKISKNNLEFDFIPDVRRGKVKRLVAPVGPDGKLVAIHTFIYDPQKKKTNVYDADKNWTEYHYDEQLRIQRLERYAKDGKLHNVEQFVWGKPGTNDACNLICKVFLDEQRTPLYGKQFFYDHRANLIQEKSYGNLSGNGPPLTLDNNGLPIENGVEIYSKEWRYSDAEQSLLLESKTKEGVRTTYEYLPGTNLPTCQLTYLKEKLQERKFWQYNADHVLIREVTDDGNRERIIREYTLRENEPYFGMPEAIEEKYWDGSQERLLQKTVLHYGKAGLIEQRDIYDSNGVFRYSESTEYDGKGRIKNEINALGWEAVCNSDELGNRIYYKDFGGRTETVFNYDLGNRLVSKATKGFDGIEETIWYEYNSAHVLLSKTDPQGHVTKYQSNPLGWCERTYLPAVPNEKGALISPVLRVKHDSCGREIQRFDPEDHQSTISYNAYGSPIKVIHPDCSIETYEYFLDGTLKRYTDQIGVVTSYERDGFRQIIRKTITQGAQKLEHEMFEYKGQKLIAKIDAEGHRTSYIYDGAGRKISEEFDGEKTTFDYDELGRQHITEKGKVRTVCQFDLLGRIEEERVEAKLTGKWLRKTVFHYDTAHNKTAVFRWINEENTQTCERFEFDSKNRLVSRIDPAGQRETIYYNHAFVNDNNQKVLQKTHTDPLGLQTIETFDTHSRLAKREKRKGDQFFSLEEKRYNARGLLTFQTDTISSRVIRTKWDYDSLSRLIALTEAEGTPDAKTTTHTYTSRGEKKTTTKPDGRLLTYQYNGLGNLELLTSSDRTVHHQMRYNKLGALIWSDGIERKVDGRGRVLAETFPCRLLIQNNYENGKRTSCRIPSANCLIEYDYYGSDLSTVSRNTLDGTELYAHTYLNRDFSGNLLHSNLPANLGSIHFSYDLCTRKDKIEAPSFSQAVIDRDPIGNICRMRTQNNESSFTFDNLYQITSERGLFNHDYQNDALYCCLQKDGEAYEINSLNQIISQVEYDKNGCTKRQGDASYTFDALDRLIHMEAPECTQTFFYDSLNRRLSSITLQNGEQKTVYYLYDGPNEIGAFDESLTPIELRILGETDHAEIGSAIAIELKGTPYVPIHDLSGNVVALLPFDHTQPTHIRYSAFGEERIDGPAKCPWRFSSKRVDETGLVYYGRRFYEPTLARWLSPDPAGFTDGMNLYAFVHNNPLTHFDEYGLLDFGQWKHPREYQQNCNQFAIGARQGLINVAYSTAHFVNAVGHGLAAPFHCYDFQARRFNFSMGSSYHAIGSWLDQHQASVNQRWSSSGNQNHWAFQTGNFAGNFAADCALGGAIFKGVYSFGKATYGVGSKLLQTTRVVEKIEQTIAEERVIAELIKQPLRKHFVPNSNASGAHTVFRRDPVTSRITHYETYRPQTNLRDPKDWESVLRFDNSGTINQSHFNKILKQEIYEPHIHDPTYPGKIRPAHSWEIPKIQD